MKILPILLILILAFGCDMTDPIGIDPELSGRRMCKVKYEVTTTSNNYNSGRIFYTKNAHSDLVFLYDQILPWTQEVETWGDEVSFGANIFSFQGTLTISIYVDDKKVFTKNGEYNLSISNELLAAHVFALPIGFCYED